MEASKLLNKMTLSRELKGAHPYPLFCQKARERSHILVFLNRKLFPTKKVVGKLEINELRMEKKPYPPVLCFATVAFNRIRQI